MVRYLLDTDALSEPIRPRPSTAFTRRLRENARTLAISSVTWHEAVFGMQRMPAGKRQEAVRLYLYETVAPNLAILAYDAHAAEVHARERARLARLGKTAPFADGQIAAVAMAHDLVLVTANVKDFEGFEDLVVENWLRG